MIVKGRAGQFDAGRKNNRQVFFPFLQQLFGQPSLAAAATPFKIEKPSVLRSDRRAPHPLGFRSGYLPQISVLLCCNSIFLSAWLNHQLLEFRWIALVWYSLRHNKAPYLSGSISYCLTNRGCAKSYAVSIFTMPWGTAFLILFQGLCKPPVLRMILTCCLCFRALCTLSPCPRDPSCCPD